MYKLLLFLTLVGIFSIPISVDEVFGHGGGGDVAPPVSFQGKDVTVSTTFSPADMTVGKVDKATISLRFFDATLDGIIKFEVKIETQMTYYQFKNTEF